MNISSVILSYVQAKWAEQMLYIVILNFFSDF